MEPIRDLLYSSMQGDQAEPDKRWVTMLKKQVQMAEVDLVASLASTQLTVADIMELRIGDVIPVEIDKVIEARVDNVPVFNCSYGTSGGQYALKVEEVLAVSNDSHADALNLEALLSKEAKQAEKTHE
tara:strand:- start:243 stop:626 length:384 start_codon:yes stop_codon:yes gene_type:complete